MATIDREKLASEQRDMAALAALIAVELDEVLARHRKILEDKLEQTLVLLKNIDTNTTKRMS